MNHIFRKMYPKLAAEIDSFFKNVIQYRKRRDAKLSKKWQSGGTVRIAGTDYKVDSFVMLPAEEVRGTYREVSTRPIDNPTITINVKDEFTPATAEMIKKALENDK